LFIGTRRVRLERILKNLGMERGGGWRPYLRGAPPYRAVVARPLVLLVLALLAVVLWPARADAAPADLRVELTVDRSEVVVDLSPDRTQTPAVLRYQVLVENLGDDLISGVEVVDELPSGLSHPEGRTVRLAVGELGARGLWRGEISATLDPGALRGAQLVNQVVVTTAAGERFSSPPASTGIVLISATSIAAPEVAPTPAAAPAPEEPPRIPATVASDARSPRPQPPTQVLGAVFTRGPDGQVVASLAQTGVPLFALTAAGLGLVAIGGLALRHVRD
jgi:uncharacterized repeat protein (TIGR01451 family)